MSSRLLGLGVGFALALSGCGALEGGDADERIESAASELERASSPPEEPGNRVAKDLGPGGLVRHYFDLINQREFSRAWRLLDASVQEQFGGFESWRDGYGSSTETTVVSTDPSGVSGGEADLTVRIRATDSCDGAAYVREFEGPWSVSTSRQMIIAADFAQVAGGSLPDGCV